MNTPTLERRTATPEGIAATAEGRQPETNDLNERFNQKISVCKIAKGAMFIQRDITVMDALEEIRDGTHAAAVATVRDAVAIYGKDTAEVKTAKCELPAFLLSGKIDGRVAKAMEGKRFHHSGLLQLDFDKLADPIAIREQIATDPHVLAAWISPSGDGVKGLLVIEPAATEEAHLAAFLTAEAYWEAKGLTIDKGCKNSNRLCFASHDPDLKRNEDAVQLATAAPKAAAPAKPSTTSTSPKLGANHGFPQPPREGIHRWLMDAAWHCRRNGLDEQAATDKLQGFDGTLRRPFQPNEVRDAIRTVYDSTTSSAGTRTAPDASDLLARAYAMAYDPDETPPPDEACMVIGDIAVAARGNLTALQGKSKVGKSAVVSAILGAAQRGQYAVKGDTLRFEWEGLAEGAIIHLDTEQSRADWHGLVTRSITRAGMPTVSERLVSLPLVMFARSERLTILQGALAKEAERQGRIDAVIIDGIADLCTSPNDEAESLELVSRIHALAQKYECPIFAILHENPSSDQGKTRGHLGSELNRKAFANLRIDKDTETSISTIFGTDMRKRDLPKEQGFCFAWDNEAKMHLFQGRAAGLKAAQREEKAVSDARKTWVEIYEIASQRENTAFPALSPKEAADIEQEISGKDDLTKTDTMKKRMQKAESLGVLRKADLLRWTLTAAGTAGK